MNLIATLALFFGVPSLALSKDTWLTVGKRQFQRESIWSKIFGVPIVRFSDNDSDESSQRIKLLTSLIDQLLIANLAEPKDTSFDIQRSVEVNLLLKMAEEFALNATKDIPRPTASEVEKYYQEHDGEFTRSLCDLTFFKIQMYPNSAPPGVKLELFELEGRIVVPGENKTFVDLIYIPEDLQRVVKDLTAGEMSGVHIWGIDPVVVRREGEIIHKKLALTDVRAAIARQMHTARVKAVIDQLLEAEKQKTQVMVSDSLMRLFVK